MGQAETGVSPGVGARASSLVLTQFPPCCVAGAGPFPSLCLSTREGLEFVIAKGSPTDYTNINGAPAPDASQAGGHRRQTVSCPPGISSGGDRQGHAVAAQCELWRRETGPRRCHLARGRAHRTTCFLPGLDPEPQGPPKRSDAAACLRPAHQGHRVPDGGSHPCFPDGRGTDRNCHSLNPKLLRINREGLRGAKGRRAGGTVVCKRGPRGSGGSSRKRRQNECDISRKVGAALTVDLNSATRRNPVGSCKNSRGLRPSPRAAETGLPTGLPCSLGR